MSRDPQGNADAVPNEPNRAAGTSTARLEASRLTKTYGSTTVLNDVSIRLAPGEVRALLGENGAGKSTLIKILSGVVRPDDAEIHLDGHLTDIATPHGAIRAGIATLHQELSIVPGLSVAENVLLGEKTPTQFGRIIWSQVARRAQELFDELGQDIDVEADVAELSPVGRTMTALARSLSRESRILILDEPTAALTDAETQLLFAAMKRLTANGVSIIYISHLLEEVVEVCDTFSVLRNGELVSEGTISDTTINELIASMAGRPIDAIFPSRASTPGEVVLQVDQLQGKRVRDTSFELHRGEILGIAGLAGSGRSEVLRLLAGQQRKRGGTVKLHGEPIDVRSVRAGHQIGLAMVPQERRSDGLIPDTIERNTNITTLARHAYARLVMSRQSATKHAQKFASDMDLRATGLDQQVLTLSGGNQQKIVLSKFLALDPEVLLLDEPTRGVDVATKSQIYRLIAGRAAAGKAIIMVSSELTEILGLAHRVLVMHNGRLIESVSADDTTEHELLLACYGRDS